MCAQSCFKNEILRVPRGPQPDPTSTLMMIFSNDFLRKDLKSLTLHCWKSTALVADLWGTDIIAKPVKKCILWLGQLGGEKMPTEGYPSCWSDTVPHDPAMFCFHRAVLGLADWLFVLAKGQQFTAIFSGCCCWQPDQSPSNYDIIENDLKPNVWASVYRKQLLKYALRRN